MTDNIDRFTDRRAPKLTVIDPNRKPAKKHPSRRHFVDECVEPIDQQELVVRRLTVDIHGFAPFHLRQVRHDGRQRQRGLLE